MLNDGTFMVVWMDSTAGAYRARARRFDGSGNPVTPPLFVNTEPGVRTGEPHVASNGSGVWYVWSTLRHGCQAGVANDLGRVVASEDVPAPGELELSVYPNPVQAEATVWYALPAAGHVELAVFDVLGREIMSLEDGVRATGPHELRLDAS